MSKDDIIKELDQEREYRNRALDSIIHLLDHNRAMCYGDTSEYTEVIEIIEKMKNYNDK